MGCFLVSLFVQFETVAIMVSSVADKVFFHLSGFSRGQCFPFKLLLASTFCFQLCCLAGESVHFFDEVHELSKIPEDDSVRRIYMACHIIEKYIASGASMEVNISHRNRQEILMTSDLARPDLFHNALNEIMQMMKTFREEANKRSDSYEIEQIPGWNLSPRLSSVHGADDPFHQDHLFKSSSGRSHD
ncbi:hypothetical protein K1719_003145 [Acacia pycnantha]|nr:hypothetical protein K1719_003145 [Acacia pycnantha]